MVSVNAPVSESGCRVFTAAPARSHCPTAKKGHRLMVNLAPFPVIPPQGAVLATDIEPAGYALHDFLFCLATSVNDAEPADVAMGALAEASLAARGLFTPGSPGEAAAGVLREACAPGRDRARREALRTALNAASLTALVAMDGRRPALLARVLRDARSAASLLPADWQAALEAILAGACPKDAGVTT